MPILQVNFIEGRTLDQKRELVSRLTTVVHEVLGSPKENIRIILNDMAKTDYAIAGTLIVDQQRT
jgi:4-oxalocrotonate tautomerase